MHLWSTISSSAGFSITYTSRCCDSQGIWECHSRLLGSVLSSISPVTALGQWITKQARPAVCGQRDAWGFCLDIPTVQDFVWTLFLSREIQFTGVTRVWNSRGWRKVATEPINAVVWFWFTCISRKGWKKKVFQSNAEIGKMDWASLNPLRDCASFFSVLLKWLRPLAAVAVDEVL